jgi:hypothetical protein
VDVARSLTRKNSVMKLINLGLLLISCLQLQKQPKEKTYVGFFSRQYPIDKTSTGCGNLSTAVIYAFEQDSIRNENSRVFYGLIPCPEMWDQSLFQYGIKLSVGYRKIRKSDMEGVLILNEHKYKGKQLVLITAISRY